MAKLVNSLETYPFVVDHAYMTEQMRNFGWRNLNCAIWIAKFWTYTLTHRHTRTHTQPVMNHGQLQLGHVQVRELLEPVFLHQEEVHKLGHRQALLLVGIADDVILHLVDEYVETRFEGSVERRDAHGAGEARHVLAHPERRGKFEYDIISIARP